MQTRVHLPYVGGHLKELLVPDRWIEVGASVDLEEEEVEKDRKAPNLNDVSDPEALHLQDETEHRLRLLRDKINQECPMCVSREVPVAVHSADNPLPPKNVNKLEALPHQ